MKLGQVINFCESYGLFNIYLQRLMGEDAKMWVKCLYKYKDIKFFTTGVVFSQSF